MAEEETLEQNSASQPRELDPNPQPKIMRASHVSVTVDTLESEFSRLGFATWKCVECGIWRVPGNHTSPCHPACFQRSDGVLSPPVELINWRGRQTFPRAQPVCIEMCRSGIR